MNPVRPLRRVLAAIVRRLAPDDAVLIRPPVQKFEKLSTSEADDLRARAAMRRTLAAERYAQARSITAGEPQTPSMLHVVGKRSE